MWLLVHVGVQLLFWQFIFSDIDNYATPAVGPVVLTRYGPIRGYFQQDVAVFLGIPYASPPVGALKFQKITHPEPWNDTLIVDRYGPKCPQVPSDRGRVSEDCLHLNVFTPELRPEQLLPVVVWFHGSEYQTGASSDLSPDYIISTFVSKGIVFVSFNYRLNFYGFLDLDDYFPPNRGLWDQLQAMKWVQENVARFGGDPSQVTAIGLDAGASSIALLLVSPLSKRLFKRVILTNGSPFNPFSIAVNTSERMRISRDMASALGCSPSPEADGESSNPTVTSCVSNSSHEKLWKAWQQIASHSQMSGPLWAPVFDGPQGILPFKNLEEVAENLPDDIEVILGTARTTDGTPRADALGMAAGNFTIGNFNQIVSDYLHRLGVSDDSIPQAVKTAQIVYGGSINPKSDALPWQDAASAVISDYWTNAGVIQFARLLAGRESNRVYLSAFGQGDLPGSPLFGHLGDDAATAEPGEPTVSSALVDLWVNFVKTGNPNPSSGSEELWHQFHEDSYACLSRSDGLIIKYMCHWACDQYWNSLILFLKNRTTSIKRIEESVSDCCGSICLGQKWREAYAYRIGICAAVFVCLCIFLVSFFAIRRLKRRLRTYHLIAAVAELNFT